MESNENLINIKERNESKINKKPANKLDKETSNKIESFEQCKETINKTVENLINNNQNLSGEIENKKNEISKNLELLLEKLEEDTNKHLQLIDSSSLSEDEKKNEYIKCLEELDKISFLSHALENCIEISEENFLKFLENPISDSKNKDNLIEFLVQEEENLKKSNIYNQLGFESKYLENLFNDTHTSYLKNYISHSSLLKEENNIKINKLKVNKNTDLGNARELLISVNSKNEIMQDKLEKIYLRDMTKEKLDYLFNKELTMIKKNMVQLQSGKNMNLVMMNNKKKESLMSEAAKELEENTIELNYSFPSITCKNCDCAEFNFNETFPKLNKLKLTSCELPFIFGNLNNNFNNFSNITELYFDNCNIVDENFKEIYFGLLKNEKIQKNLRALSFKNNKLSYVSVYKYFDQGDITIFKLFGLQFLNFSNNNIIYFNINLFESIPNIQLLDFSNNNIQFKQKLEEFYSFIKTRKKKKAEAKSKETGQTETEQLKYNQGELLFQIGGNVAFIREPNQERYCQYLIDTIPCIDYPLKCLNLSGIFFKTNLHEYLFKLNLSNAKSSIVELDLSYCNLTDDEVSKLLLNQFLLKNLKKLNLSHNRLTDNLFKLLTENNSHDFFDKLRQIDLSNNNIQFSNLKEVKNFIRAFDSIQKIFLYATPIEENINNYIKKRIKRYNEEKYSKKITTKFNKEELNIKELFDIKDNQEDKFGNLSNIKLYMNNLIEVLIEEKENMKIKNGYNQILEENLYLENLLNESQIPFIKNYISQTSILIDGNEKKINKLKVKENIDLESIRKLLISLDNKNGIIEDKIEKISLDNIPKKSLDYLFNKNVSPIKRNMIRIQSGKNAKIDILNKKMKESLVIDYSKELNELNINFPYVTLKNCDCSQINFNEIFPNINKLKLYSCELLNNFNSFSNVTELYLENCNIVDSNFAEISYEFLLDENLNKNLKALSFKNNKISYVSIYNYIMQGDMPNYKFFALEFLDFSNNNINYFNVNLFGSLPICQVLDFSNNNIQSKQKIDEIYDYIKKRKKKVESSKDLEIKKKEASVKSNSSKTLTQSNLDLIMTVLFQIGGNIAYNKEGNQERYCKYLIDTIPHVNYPLKSLNLSGIFHKKYLHQYLLKLDLSSVRSSIVELDLSLCNLTDDEVSKLLLNQFLLKNLKKLNLSSNNLTDNFFKLLNKSNESYVKLKQIDLSNNNIQFSNMKEVKNLVKSFDKLQRIIIHDTPIEENINNFIKKTVMRNNEEKTDKVIKTEFNNEELNVQELFKNKDNQNEKFGNKSNVKLCLNNRNEHNLLEACKNLCPELFNKIEIKC